MTFLITGCSRGVGFELAKQSLTLGHKFFACMRDVKKSSELNSLVEVIPLSATEDDLAKLYDFRKSELAW